MKLEIAEAPATVTDCNCSICRRYGTLWAYYTLDQVRVTGGPTDIYFWDDHAIDFHRCRVCGCVTHWSPVDTAANRMGINARLMEPQVLARSRMRHLDGANTERYVD
ncbi:MAG: hypothetical protein ABSD74_08710 [Rhizomicrobium sp.]